MALTLRTRGDTIDVVGPTWTVSYTGDRPGDPACHLDFPRLGVGDRVVIYRDGQRRELTGNGPVPRIGCAFGRLHVGDLVSVQVRGVVILFSGRPDAKVAIEAPPEFEIRHRNGERKHGYTRRRGA
jgi:hypothetical protein